MSTSNKLLTARRLATVFPSGQRIHVDVHTETQEEALVLVEALTREGWNGRHEQGGQSCWIEYSARVGARRVDVTVFLTQPLALACADDVPVVLPTPASTDSTSNTGSIHGER